MNSIVNYLEKYSDNIFVIQIWLLIIILATITWLWFYNRKKYNHLKHQIPASVVKNYLDSIIQNSTALKSSLFRGGGIDVDLNNIPSVMPLAELPGTTAVNLDDVDADAALKAQVAELQAQLANQKNITAELESKNSSLEEVINQKEERIKELEALLASASSESGAPVQDPAIQAKLDEVTAERDELLESLKQYEIISGDLADLKRLKQENEQLRNALAAAGGSVEAAPVESSTPIVEAPPEEVAEEVTEPEAEQASSDIADEPAPFAEDAAEEPIVAASAQEEEEVQADAPSDDEDDEEASPEDLLSEFEKMLK